ncbi:complex I NDUFA9 subunit family protein [Rhodobacter sp. Har01]|uniref:complex I NDUFA9 subunit family protein n=1 Tax=Rhodobacter sp. Har01 TaxID=2883999 RepID=UPI001D071A82|nr:complex I NDUFA9 subunit family protein [Rhodobacter sp. Har01]MCB6178107.1 complex I NDUFA9 subunit family protein [Rhodobacter sp. Har01]
MSRLVTIFGGSGFVGRYIARRMAREGWRVRVAVRRPNEALFVKSYGTPGQVEPVFCNIRDDDSVRAVTQGAEAVVNCVGTFDRRGNNSFHMIHVRAPARIARIAAEEGVQRLVHISALGADARSPSLYGQSKAAGEAAVREAFPQAVILRPSVIFGPEDNFFNRFAEMGRTWAYIPVARSETRFQPVYVDDVARAAVKGALGQAEPGIYELGGPEVATFRNLLKKMLGVIQRRRAVINMPGFVIFPVALAFDLIEFFSGGVLRNGIITRDQLRSLRVPNVVSPGAKGLAELGIEPTAMETVLPEYLWRYRPSGQFAAIKDSAKNLKKM